MGLLHYPPVPVAGVIVFAGRRMQQNAEEKNYDAYRAAYDGVQEYLDVVSELRSSGTEQEYLAGVRKKTGQCNLRVHFAMSLFPVQ